MAEDVPFDLEAIRTRCSQNITEIVANPREYFRVQQILRDRLALLAEVDRLRALQRSEVLSGDSQSSSETEGYPGIAHDFETLRAAVRWVINDAAYKAPELIGPDMADRWITRLQSALDESSRSPPPEKASGDVP